MLTRSERLVAVTRFGLGPSAADLADASADPRGYVLSQIDAETPTPRALLHLQPLDVLREEFRAGRDELNEARKSAATEERRREIQRAIRERTIAIYRTEAEARVRASVETRTPLVERLVWFWQNHFAIIINAPPIRVVAGNYEREAIRPFVFGRFEDMAIAAILHPAMLHYLDNVQSIGPNSPVGRRRERNINENLAREVLELHTLGVDGGYTQEDVRNLALVLTGWRGGMVGPVDAANDFFTPGHEPGPKTVLGKRYPDDGPGQAIAVLRDLSRHPATARHVAGKLARHFTSDTPPPGLVDRLEATFLETDGDLAAVTEALVTSDAAWTASPAKFLPPPDFIVSSVRAFGKGIDLRAFNQGSRLLGWELWHPKAPTGWPDEDDAWLGGDHLLERLDWATVFADRFARVPDEPVAYAQDLFGPDLDPDLEVALGRAESKEQALALLLLSSQFQRR